MRFGFLLCMVINSVVSIGQLSIFQIIKERNQKGILATGNYFWFSSPKLYFRLMWIASPILSLCIHLCNDMYHT